MTERGFVFSAKQISNGQEILALLNCRRLPARLSTGETAVLLGFQEHDIAPLVAAKLLAPLGKPATNAPVAPEVGLTRPVSAALRLEPGFESQGLALSRLARR